MPNNHPERFENITVLTKANVYFDGKVVSHTVLFADGSRKSVGVIHPGTFTFNTDAAEEMAITAGTCRVRLAGSTEWKSYAAGQLFAVAAKSAFDICVEQGLCQYICSFLK